MQPIIPYVNKNNNFNFHNYKSPTPVAFKGPENTIYDLKLRYQQAMVRQNERKGLN